MKTSTVVLALGWSLSAAAPALARIREPDLEPPCVARGLPGQLGSGARGEIRTSPDSRQPSSRDSQSSKNPGSGKLKDSIRDKVVDTIVDSLPIPAEDKRIAKDVIKEAMKGNVPRAVLESQKPARTADELLDTSPEARMASLRERERDRARRALGNFLRDIAPLPPTVDQTKDLPTPANPDLPTLSPASPPLTGSPVPKDLLETNPQATEAQRREAWLKEAERLRQETEEIKELHQKLEKAWAEKQAREEAARKAARAAADKKARRDAARKAERAAQRRDEKKFRKELKEANDRQNGKSLGESRRESEAFERMDANEHGGRAPA